MNKIYYSWMVVLFMTLLSPQLYAQNEQFQPEKRIYLWDVTLSMKGFKGAPDIYEPVVEALKKDINNITDPNTEIVVMPFQEGVLAEWESKATASGKKALKEKIEKFINNDTTYTNILAPFKHAIQNHIDPDKSNIIILMTDGKHNDESCSKATLINEIKKWGELTKSVNAHAFYVILTSNANDPELTDVIVETEGMDTVNLADKNYDLGFCQLIPQAKVAYNIKDDAASGAQMTINCNKNSFPENVKLHIQGHNEYIEIDSNQVVGKDGELKFQVDSLTSLGDMPEKFDLDLQLELSDTGSNDRIYLVKDNSKLTVINKKEKVLKIYVKDDK